MPDFGNAGTITVRTDLDEVLIHLNANEYLSFNLAYDAPAPVFAFSCTHRKWLTNADFPSQNSPFTWTHFQKNGDDDNPNDRYRISMSFLGAPSKYKLIVKHLDKHGTPIKTVKDIDFASTDPSDFIVTSFAVISI